MYDVILADPPWFYNSRKAGNERNYGENILDSSEGRGYDASLECFSGRPRMTLCIAATCYHEDEPVIVCCCDESSTRDNVISQSSFKMAWLGRVLNPSVNVMLAGRLNAARELIEYCRPALTRYSESESNDLAVNALLKDLREAVLARRSELNDHYLAAEYCFRYDEFLAHGKQWFSESERAQIRMELKEVGLNDASLIISSFTDGEGLIIEVTNDTQVTWVDHFAVQGTGARIANAILQQRDYDDRMELEECLYRVLEAKRAAERDPYVGLNTITVLLLPSGVGYLTNAQDYTDLVAERHKIPPLPKAQIVTQDDVDRRTTATEGEQ